MLHSKTTVILVRGSTTALRSPAFPSLISPYLPPAVGMLARLRGQCRGPAERPRVRGLDTLRRGEGLRAELPHADVGDGPSGQREDNAAQPYRGRCLVRESGTIRAGRDGRKVRLAFCFAGVDASNRKSHPRRTRIVCVRNGSTPLRVRW